MKPTPINKSPIRFTEEVGQGVRFYPTEDEDKNQEKKVKKYTNIFDHETPQNKDIVVETPPYDVHGEDI